jgi:signal transduction histidine kinase
MRVKVSTEERLRRQLAQQEALANLSSAALSGRAILEVATDAVEMIARVLEVRCANIWRVRESVGITLAASFGEARFTAEVIESLVAANQSSVRERSAVFMIGGAGVAAGALVVNSLRHFRSDEIRFLSAVANLLAQAIDRERTVESDTVREHLEHQLEQANRLTSLGRLAATVAHEFNNVLMGISPFVELLKRGDIAYDRRLSALDHMTKSIQRGRRITEEIFRFTNPVDPVFEAVPLAQWSQAVAQELRPLLGNQYTFNVELQQPDVRALADIGQLHQVISNLVINARDAMPDGGRITLRILREPADALFDFGVMPEPENFIHLIVEDEGGGMSAETKHHIFEPLFTTKRNGTGLGLAITHQVVQRHDGMIFVESEIGKGTRFHIFLRAADFDVPKRSPEAQPLNTTAQRRVLLVEDDPNVATGIALLLQEENFIVDVVNLGADALEAIFRTQPDVVVLDIGLPDIDGTKVYEEIAASYASLPVVFSTGHGDARKLEPYLARGNVAMLLKPYDIEKLIAAIDRLTAGR